MLRHEDPRFTVEESQEIIGLASRLQATEAETLSAYEIEQAAAEMGIGPEYVRQAVAQFQRRPERADSSLSLRLIFALLVVAQCLAVFTALSGRLTEWSGAHLWLLAALGLALGGVGVLTRSRWMVAGWALATLVIVGGVCGGWLHLLGTPIEDNWPTYLRNLAGFQLILTLLGSFLGQAVRYLTIRRNRTESTV